MRKIEEKTNNNSPGGGGGAAATEEDVPATATAGDVTVNECENLKQQHNTHF